MRERFHVELNFQPASLEENLAVLGSEQRLRRAYPASMPDPRPTSLVPTQSPKLRLANSRAHPCATNPAAIHGRGRSVGPPRSVSLRSLGFSPLAPIHGRGRGYAPQAASARPAGSEWPEPTRGIVRVNSFTLPKRQNRISWPLIFLHFPGRSERFDGRSKYLEFCSDNAHRRNDSTS